MSTRWCMWILHDWSEPEIVDCHERVQCRSCGKIKHLGVRHDWPAWQDGGRIDHFHPIFRDRTIESFSVQVRHCKACNLEQRRQEQMT